MLRVSLVALALSVTTLDARELPPVLCDAGEKVWFSGYAEDLDTIISICGSETLTGPDAWVQMRYGEYGGDILTHPAERAGSAQAFRFSRYTRPRVTYVTLETQAEGLTYRIFDAYYADDAEVTGASLSVIHGNGEETSHPLTVNTETMAIGAFENAVPNKPFLE